MLTMSGNVLPFGESLGRIALLAVLVTIQVWAVAAVALAISAATEHPLVVLAADARRASSCSRSSATSPRWTGCTRSC